MRKILFLVLGIIFFNFNSAFALNLKQEEGKFLIENSFYQVTISERGGCIKSLIVKSTGDNLTEDTGIGNDIEIIKGHPGNIFTSYQLKIEVNSKEEVLLKASAKGSGSEVTYEKTYIFKEGTPLIKVKVRIINEGGPKNFGYRVHNVVKTGESCSGDIYFLQTTKGIKTFRFLPGKMKPSNWLKDFSSGWVGAIDPEKKEGILYKVDAQAIDQFLFWFGSNSSTIEWYYKSAPIEKGDIFETYYFILPLQDISNASSAVEIAKEITKGDKTESRVILAKRKKRNANSKKILIAGTEIMVNLNNFRLYNVEKSLRKNSFPLAWAEGMKRTVPRYETHYLKWFPVSKRSLLDYPVIILVDIPSWMFTEKDQDNLISYVKEGGNLIFVGDHARGYKGTKLAEIFPLEFDYTKEVKGYRGRLLKDKSAWLKPIIVDKNNPIVRGLALDIPEIVVHKSKIKQGKLILNCGDYPLLAERDYGKGKIISFPISLTGGVSSRSAWPDGDVKYNFWDDKLINWSFYDKLWRNIILYCQDETPPVDFSRVVPPEKLITYPASIDLFAEITNFSNISQKGFISLILYKNKKEIRKENTKYNLSPDEKRKIAFNLKVDYPRGDYSYRIEIKNRKGDTLSCFDGNFSAIPKTFLKVEIPIIPVFGRNSSVNLTIKPFNLNKDSKYFIKTSLFDFREKKIEELSPIEVVPPKAFYLKAEAMKQSLPLGNLMKGNYQIAIELLENGKKTDIVKKDISIVPSLEKEDLYPNIIMGIATTDKEQTLKNVRKAKGIGFNGVHNYQWAAYRRRFRDYNRQRVGFYAFQEAQRLGMLFCPNSHYGQGSWNRWYKGCPNTIITEDIEKKDIEEMKDYLSLYESSPKHLAVYAADEPGVRQHKWQTCPVCRKAFKDKYGYKIATDIKDRNYYTSYKFICDKMVESLKKTMSFVKKYNPKIKVSAALNRCGSLREMLNINGIVSTLDIAAVDHYEYGKDPYCLDLLWGASNFKNNIWLMPTTAVCHGGTYSPRYIGTQVYNALCHNAKGLIWYVWKVTDSDLLADPERVEYGERVFKELKEIGPLFKRLIKRRAKVAMLHPWTTLVFEETRYSAFYRSLPVFYTLFRQSFGQVDILQEEQIRANKFLSEYNVFILPSVAYLPEDVMKRIKDWVKEGGILIVFPGTGLYNEYQEKSNTLSEVFSTSYGKEVSLPIKGVGVLPVSGYVLNPIGSEVLYRYTSGEAAITENSYGKGKVILFGFVPKNKEVLEKITKGIDTGVIKSSNKNVDIGFFYDQSTCYIVAVNQGKRKEKANILLKVPNKRYYIYDLLTGKKVDYSYKNNNLVVPVEFEPLWGRVLAILEEKPAKLTVALDSGSYTRGRLLTYKIRLLNKKGEILNAKLPINIRIIDSEGRTREEYAGVRVLNKGFFSKTITLANNESIGTWRINVKERISGKEIRKSFIVK